jgi:uncharacterized membrane protein
MPSWLRRPRAGLVALAVGLGVGVLAGQWPAVHLRGALLMGWSAAVAVHAALVLRFLLGASADALRQGGLPLDGRRWPMIGAAAAASLAALTAVSWEIGGGYPTAPFSVPLGVATIVLSWAFMHIFFAYHYAQAFWQAGGGLDFPGGDAPDGPEFLYFAFTIGITGAVSDVTTSAPAMRRLVLAHSLAAFTFNAAVVGAAVNILA